MKNASQITLFGDMPASDENQGVGVRLKSLKKKNQDGGLPVTAESRNTSEVLQDEAREVNAEGNIDASPILPESHANEPPDPEEIQNAAAIKEGDQFPAIINTEDEFPISTTVEKHELPEAIHVEAQMSSADDAGTAVENYIEPINQTEDTDFHLSLNTNADIRAIPEGEYTAEHNEESTAEAIVDDFSQSPLPKSSRGRKSLKNIESGADLINIPPDEELFKKQYYAIGEVAEMFHVNQSLIRFWETEFDIIQPRKNRKGDRHFRPVDIKNLLLIHDLLRRRKLTIEGAKDFLKNNKRSPERFAMIQSLQQIRAFILEVKATL